MNICACGCGGVTKKTYVHGHNRRGKPRSIEACDKLKQTWITKKDEWCVSLKKSANTPEFKEKLSKAHLGRKLSEEHKAKIGAGNRGKVRTAEQRAFLSKQLYKLRYEQSKHKAPTKIESIVYSYLESIGIEFVKQYKIGGGFIVDAFIPSLNLVVEVDGKYWHSTPRGIETDKRKESFLTNNNYNFIRIPEDSVYDNTYQNILNLKLIKQTT